MNRAAALRALRDTAEADVERLTRSLDEIRHARSDGTADDEHDPEGSTLSSDWSQLVGLRRAALQRRDDIDRALERVATGTDGICARCGQPIPPARLEARPAADTCVACAR